MKTYQRSVVLPVGVTLGVLFACGASVTSAVAGQGDIGKAPPPPNPEVRFAAPGANGAPVGGNEKIDRSWRHEAVTLTRQPVRKGDVKKAGKP